MRELEDACGRKVRVPDQPQRIVCLCPSLTETLVSLGLGARLVGRTRYCIHPAEAVGDIPIVGGTKKLDMEALASSSPDLIIAEKEENRREDVESLAQHWPVYVCDIQNLDDARAAIEQLGWLCGELVAAQNLSHAIQCAWTRLPKPSVTSEPLSVLYLIWRKPWMAAGRDTYINAVLEQLGFHNAVLERGERYPVLSDGQLADLKPQLCLLSSEPYPFAAKHQMALSKIWPDTRIELVDGEMFSWYGSRMLEAANYLAGFLGAMQTGSEVTSRKR